MSAMHGGGGKELTPDVKKGLTVSEVESQRAAWGWNELPHIEVPLWWVFFVQFTGTMPYMLEVACILAAAVEDFIDFAIIFAMLVCNGESEKILNMRSLNFFSYHFNRYMFDNAFDFHLFCCRISWFSRRTQG